MTEAALPVSLLTAASVLAWAHLLRGGPRLARWASLSAAAGTASLGAFLAVSSWAQGRAPWGDVTGALWSATLLVCVAHLLLASILRIGSLGAFLLPVAAGLGWTGLLVRGEGRTWGSSELWMPLHGVMALLGFGAFAVAFAVAAMYLLQERQLHRHRVGPIVRALPSLEALERLCGTAGTLGFLFFTLSLAAGVVGASLAWPRTWMREPVVAWNLATWFAYAALVHLRASGRVRGRRVAAWSAAGFALFLAGFLLPALWAGGRH